MAKFKIGDKVRVKTYSSPSALSTQAWPKGKSRIGIIESKVWTKVCVRLDDGSEVHVTSYDLEKQEKV